MISIRNIQSLTTFKRKTSESVRRLKKNKSPLVLTVNGKAELVVLEASEYEEMLGQIELAQTVTALNEGIQAYEKGEYKPALKALSDLKKKYAV